MIAHLYILMDLLNFTMHDIAPIFTFTFILIFIYFFTKKIFYFFSIFFKIIGNILPPRIAMHIETQTGLGM